MAKIITITFSPCIDKSASVDELIPEKKMKCASLKSEPGGGGINVARVIHLLGGGVKAVFPSGGPTGAHLKQLLQNEKVPFEAIPCSNETRENFAILEESTQKQYRFGMPGSELSQSEWSACLKRIEDLDGADFIVASGSLPLGVPSDIFAQLSKIAKKLNAKFIADTSGDALRQALEQGAYLAKPNLQELGILLGRAHLETGDVEDAARQLISGTNCEIIVTSLGALGAMMVTRDRSYTVRPPETDVRSTIGAGDSMVGGIVYALSNGESPEGALQYGVACGTAATMNPGSQLCQKKDVEMLLEIIRS